MYSVQIASWWYLLVIVAYLFKDLVAGDYSAESTWVFSPETTKRAWMFVYFTQALASYWVQAEAQEWVLVFWWYLMCLGMDFVWSVLFYHVKSMIFATGAITCCVILSLVTTVLYSRYIEVCGTFMIPTVLWFLYLFLLSLHVWWGEEIGPYSKISRERLIY